MAASAKAQPATLNAGWLFFILRQRTIPGFGGKMTAIFSTNGGHYDFMEPKAPFLTSLGVDFERGIFERYASAEGFNLTRSPVMNGQCLEPDCDYVSELTSQRWAGWLARADFMTRSQ